MSRSAPGADDFGALSINKLVIDDIDGYFIENNSSSLAIGDGGVETDATADNNGGGGGQASFTPPVTLTEPQTWTFGTHGPVLALNGENENLDSEVGQVTTSTAVRIDEEDYDSIGHPVGYGRSAGAVSSAGAVELS
jgi:hypothetical protein